MIFDVGRVCMKIAGREASRYCVIVEKGKDFVIITGPKTITGVKRRRCNVSHLEATEHVLETSGDDTAVETAWKNSGLIDKLGIKK